MKRRLVMGVLALTMVTVLGGSLVTAAEKYLVCSDITWPPFEWMDTAGNIYGFDMDAMRLIALVEGFEITIEHRDWDLIFDEVGTGRCDIGASGATITAERELKVDFSAPYWTSDQAILVRTDSGLNIVTALSKGYSVGAQVETTGAAWIQENLIDQGVAVILVEYPLYPLAVLDLINGNIQAVIQDEPASAASAAVEPEIEIVGIIKTYENFGFFVAEGDPKGILEKLNSGVQKLKASGAWDNLIKAYMGTEQSKVEAAWQKCKHLLNDGLVDEFAKCLAEEATAD